MTKKGLYKLITRPSYIFKGLYKKKEI